jgi:hypothetical protein
MTPPLTSNVDGWDDKVILRLASTLLNSTAAMLMASRAAQLFL